MSVTMLFYIAIFVFIMMIIGLGLIVWEFRYGEPARQDRQSEAETRQNKGSENHSEAA